MDNSTHIEPLVRYLDGEMDEKEKLEFENKLKEDHQLREELENLRLARESVRYYGLKQQVAAVHTSMMNESRPPAIVRGLSTTAKFIRYTIAIAASAALIFIAVEGYNFYRLSPNRLYSENFVPYELLTPRSGDSGAIPESEIEKAFREKRYADITSIVPDGRFSPTEAFLRGMSYLETNDLPRAIASFQGILEDTLITDPNDVRDESEYYLSLAYLRNRDYDQAIEIMSKIYEDPTHRYHEKISKKYLRKVKRLKWR